MSVTTESYPPMTTPPPPAKSGPNIVKIVLIAVVCLGLFFGILALAGVFSSPGGYNNVKTLDNSVESQLNARLAASGSSERVTEVSCNHLTGDQYQCVIVGNEGPSDTSYLNVTVAPDGQTWAANG